MSHKKTDNVSLKNVNVTGSQTKFNDLDVIRREIKHIERRSDFEEQYIKDIEAIIQMEYAYLYANKMCKAKRRRVGAVLYKDQHPISSGFNGTRPKEPNECEYSNSAGDLVTKPNVIHAERNAIYKLTSIDNTPSPRNSSLFATTANCGACSEPIIMNGISTVYFTELYRGVDGLEDLIRYGITIKHIDLIKEKITTIYQSDAESNIENKINSIIALRDMFEKYEDGAFHHKKYDAMS